MIVIGLYFLWGNPQWFPSSSCNRCASLPEAMPEPVDEGPLSTIGFEISIDQPSSPNTPSSTIIGSLLTSCSSQIFLICSDCLSISLMVLAILTSIHLPFNHSMSPNARCCTNGFLNFFFTHLSALSYQGSTPSPKVFSKENCTYDKPFSESNTLHLIVCKTKLILKFLCHFLIPFLYMVQRMYNRIHLSVISARHNLILKKLFRLNSTMKNCSWQCEWWDSNPHCRDFKSPVSAIGLHSLATQVGLEPTTNCLEGSCSILWATESNRTTGNWTQFTPL